MLEKDYYLAKMIGKNITFQRILLVKNDSLWKWEGALHESLSHPHLTEGAFLEGVVNLYNHVPGHRSSQKDKWLKDIETLEKALQFDPENTRYVFYLAQTYAVQGELEKALKQYLRRVEMGERNSKEEMFWALYCVGCLQSDLKRPREQVLESLLRAHDYDRSRAESLYRLADELQQMESYILAYLMIQEAMELPFPKGALKVQHAVYDYLLLVKLAELSCLIGKREESLQHYLALAKNPKIPEHFLETIQENIRILS